MTANEVLKLKMVLWAILTIVGVANSFAQVDKELKTEDDGYKWYLISSDSGNWGAQSENGKEIIPLQAGFDWVDYDNGFLCGTIFSPDGDLEKTRNAYYDKNGNAIIALDRYDIVSYYPPEDEKPAWFSVKKNGLEGACDNTGKEIVPPIYTGLLYGSKGFKGREEESGEWNLLGITLPGHDIMAFVEKRQKTESDGFVWYELRDYPNFGAADEDGNILLPMSLQLTRIKYINSKKQGKRGIFEVHKGDNIGIYDIHGNEILSPDRGYTYWQYKGDSKRGYFRVDRGNAEYGFCDLHQNEIIAPGKYSYVSYNVNGFFEVQQEDYEGICNLDGKEIIFPNKYTSITHINFKDETQWFSVEKDGKEGACDMHGRELVPALYSGLYYDDEVGFCYEKNGNDIALNIKLSSSYAEEEYYPSTLSAKRNVEQNYAHNQASSKYTALTDPNLLDNSEKILECETRIQELRQSMKECLMCHGTGVIKQNCYMCGGFGMTGYGKYRHACFSCHGTGKKETACTNCRKTELAISFANKLLEGYQKTHGMTKEAAKLYYEHEAWKAQSDRDYQNAVNDIVDSYLDDSHNSSNGSGTSSSSDSKICPYCGGTGVSKIGILGSGGVNVAYTNASGEECPYCDDYDYEFHHHDRCTCKIR